MVLSKDRIKNWIVITLLLLLLFSSYPYVFCQFIPLPDVKTISITFLLVFLFMLLIMRKITIFPLIFTGIVIIQSCCWILFSIIHHDSTYITRVIFIFIAYLSLLCIYNTSFGIRNFSQLYSKFIFLMAFGGTICFFLVFLFSFTPFFNFNNQDGRTAYCFGLTCTNAYIGNVIRYAGYFDEPGAMAYWGIFALLSNRLFFYNRKFELYLMLLLTFTFSMAYYIQAFFYIAFFYIKEIKHFLILVLSALIIISGIYLTKDTDYDIYRFTIYRFEMDESIGELQGNNRAELTEKAKIQFKKEPIFGIGAQNLNDIDYMADNPYEILAKDGIVGTIVTYLPLMIMFIVGIKKEKSFLYASIILALGYLQRPFHVNIMHVIMLYILTLLTILENRDLFLIKIKK
ncbi:predicted protein [Bacteroides sp. CAG:633]|nr:predicted protein [Bacteroides sp. CAG:633]